MTKKLKLYTVSNITEKKVYNKSCETTCNKLAIGESTVITQHTKSHYEASSP